MPITHASVSTRPDNPDPDVISSGEWNEAHAGHDKALHDVLGIDAHTVDGKHASDLATAAHIHTTVPSHSHASAPHTHPFSSGVTGDVGMDRIAGTWGATARLATTEKVTTLSEVGVGELRGQITLATSSLVMMWFNSLISGVNDPGYNQEVQFQYYANGGWNDFGPLQTFNLPKTITDYANGFPLSCHAAEYLEAGTYTFIVKMGSDETIYAMGENESGVTTLTVLAVPV